MSDQQMAAAPASNAVVAAAGRVKAAGAALLSAARPWSEMADRSSFSKPADLAEVREREREEGEGIGGGAWLLPAPARPKKNKIARAAGRSARRARPLAAAGSPLPPARARQTARRCA